MLLILGIAILIPRIPFKSLAVAICSAAILISSVKIPYGIGAIVSSHLQYIHRIETVAEAKHSGQTDLTLELILIDNQYSAFWDLRDLSTETADTWPNSSMAKYFGVESIIGK